MVECEIICLVKNDHSSVKLLMYIYNTNIQYKFNYKHGKRPCNKGTD